MRFALTSSVCGASRLWFNFHCGASLSAASATQPWQRIAADIMDEEILPLESRRLFQKTVNEDDKRDVKQHRDPSLLDI